MKTLKTYARPLMSLVIALLVFWPVSAEGHCDSMNGPVVLAAKKAIETGDIHLVLLWVQKQDEAVIRKAFAQTLAVRALGPEAKTMADMYFFETVVRVHRAGEGEPYTGLKPAGAEVDPGITAADHALESGSAKELVTHLTETVHHGLHERFQAVTAARNFRSDDLAAGRHYVKAYVEFIHYVERLYQAAEQTGHLHESEHVGMR